MDSVQGARAAHLIEAIVLKEVLSPLFSGGDSAVAEYGLWNLAQEAVSGERIR